jgi:hypothetical protein
VDSAETAETAEKPRKLTVTQAATEGTHRELLVALQARGAAAVQAPNCNPVALAALSRQLVLISKSCRRLLRVSKMRLARLPLSLMRLGTVPSE